MSKKNTKKLTVAIIPARGGSKSIPKKNIIDFCGKPLLNWTVGQAKASKYIDDVYVTTDDDDIVKVAKRCGAKIIKRPKNISGDKSSSELALKHAIKKIEGEEKIKIEYVVFLQATSPLRETKDINSAIEIIKKEKTDSLFSGARLGDFYIWKKIGGKLNSINYDYKNRKMRQDFGEQYVENGSIYIFKPEVLFKYNNRFGNSISISQMEFWKSFEVDEHEDLELCETFFKLKGLNKIK